MKTRHRTVVVLVVLALFAALEWDQWRDDRGVDARQRRDSAAVETAGGRLTYEEVSQAWIVTRGGRALPASP